MGDGVLALFGAPAAQEDAPVRAVRAALRAVARVADLPPGPDGTRLAARAGVHTGLVVVGTMGSGDAAVAVDVVGETPNLASRLQAAVSPGEVVVSDATAVEVHGFIDLQPMGELTLRGVGRPVVAHRAHGITDARDRIEARRLLPLVGRDRPLATIVTAAAEAKGGSSRLVVILGDAGMGKSRLVAEARRHPTLVDLPAIEWRGAPDHAHTPLHSVIEHLGRLDDVTLPGQLAELLEPLDTTAGEAPERRRYRTIGAVRDWVVEQAADGLSLLVVDDLQWIDPTTVELLDSLVEEPLDVPLLVLVASRPEVELPWLLGGHVDVVRLEPLDDADIVRLIEHVGGPLDAKLATRVAERSEGVPLFVEELVRFAMIGERGLDDVPSTLSGLLHARLVRVGDHLDLVRLSSVLGRDFGVPLLQAASGLREDDLRARLKELAAAGVFGDEVDGVVSFRHVLLRDAVYDSLLLSRRRQLHRLVAEVLVERFEPIVARRPEELARHWSGADAHEEAVEAWRWASVLAAGRFALAEAAEHLHHALAELAQTPPGDGRDAWELELLLTLGPIVFRLRGGGAPEIASVYERAEGLARVIEDDGQRFAVLQLLYSHFTAKADHSRSDPLGAELVALADSLASARPRIMAHAWFGCDLVLSGDLDRAGEHLGIVMELYDPARQARFDLDPGVGALTFIALIALERGDEPEALRLLAQADEWGVGRPPFTQAWCALTTAKAHALRGDVAAAAAAATTGAALSAEHGFAQIEPQTRSLLGWVQAFTGDAAAGAEAIRTAISAFARAGSVADSTFHQLLLAQALRRAGDHDGADEACRAGLAFAEENGERLHVARLEAELSGQTRSMGDT